MDQISFETFTKHCVREELMNLPAIGSIEELRDLCTNVEKEALSLCYKLTYKNAKILFNSVLTENVSDYIVDSDGLFYSISCADDILEKSKLLIAINTVKSTNNPIVQTNVYLEHTGKYDKICILVPKNLIKTNVIIANFYKNIFETAYCWFKEQVILYVSDTKNCVARNLYAYLRSIVKNKELLENFWLAIVGQGYGFRLLDYDLTLNSFELISNNTNTYGSYTNKLVTELLSTRLPSDKMLMQIAINNKKTLIGELRKAIYTVEGSIYSTTLYSLYGGESFVIWPIYIDDFSIVALYPVNFKNEIEKKIKSNLNTIHQVIKQEMTQLMSAYNLFSNRTLYSNVTIPQIAICIRKILSILNEASVLISKDVGIDVYDIFKSHYDYNEIIFNSAMKILKDNYYVIQDSTGNYHITDSGILCLLKGEIKVNQNDKTQSFNFYGGNFYGNAIGTTIQGDLINNGIDIKAFNDIISQIFEVVKYQNQFDQDIIISEIEKLRSEVTSKQPNKDIIKNTLDWIQKTTSIAGFGITLGQVLAPLLGNYIH